jgi:hypothetical protein
MEAAGSCEKFISICHTALIQSHLHTHRYDNLNSHTLFTVNCRRRAGCICLPPTADQHKGPYSLLYYVNGALNPWKQSVRKLKLTTYVKFLFLRSPILSRSNCDQIVVAPRISVHVLSPLHMNKVFLICRLHVCNVCMYVCVYGWMNGAWTVGRTMFIFGIQEFNHP